MSDMTDSIVVRPMSEVDQCRQYCKGDWAQDSRRILSNITDCGYDTTHLQENPQRLG